MAETFKNVRSIVTTSVVDAYVCPASTTAIVLKGRATNVNGSQTTGLITAQWTDSSAANAVTRLVYQTPVPNQASLIFAEKEVLETGDKLQVLADANSILEVTLSILEIS